MHNMAASHTDEGKGQYFWVWGALLVLTAIEVVLAYEQVLTPLHMLEVLMVLSFFKAALIIAYFMHLKFERLSLVLTIVPMLVICICLLFVFFPDSFRSRELRATAPAAAPAHTGEAPSH